jgi:uncharacterized membrane protein
MHEPTPVWTFVRQRRFLALRAGVAAATATVGPSFARGLLPRSAADQAMVTGAAAAYGLGFASLGLSTIEAVSELVVKARRGGDPENGVLITSCLVAAGAATVAKAIPDAHDVPLPLATVRAAAWIATGGAVASALVVGSDRALEATVGPRPLPVNLAVAIGLGSTASLVRVVLRNRRARRYGEGAWQQRRAFVAERAPVRAARAVGTGAAVGAGLVGLVGVQFAIAEGTPKLVSRVLGRPADPVTPLVGHAAAATVLAAVGLVALDRVRRYVLRADDVIEPAYPEPPTSPHVSAGPSSVVAFDAIGKEGRRFVTMALTTQEITAVMGEPAIDPVRVVAGFGSATRPEDRARIALAELERLGGFERSTIVVAAPTGVGYVNYSFAEAVEYLTRGDCAVVVAQYALMPSALSLHLTRDGELQQRLILEGIHERVADLDPEVRPRVLHFGESLGAEVALDIASEGTAQFEALGLSAGLYLGTPFRAELWERWAADPAAVDPAGLLGQVSRADEIPALPTTVRHVQVIHHDDPVTKFDPWMVVRTPVWMGPPASRPPGVPRETAFRPVITFIVGLIDLKNGMNSKPGEFVRVGHDYRIELCDAVRHVYDLPATDEQVERIEAALRDREREWATRRMVASRFASAREAVRATLHRWGQGDGHLDLDAMTAAELARGGVLAPHLEALEGPADEAYVIVGGAPTG